MKRTLENSNKISASDFFRPRGQHR